MVLAAIENTIKIIKHIVYKILLGHKSTRYEENMLTSIQHVVTFSVPAGAHSGLLWVIIVYDWNGQHLHGVLRNSGTDTCKIFFKECADLEDQIY